MKLRVPGSIDGKEVSFSPSVTPGDIPPLVGNDHLIPWGCSIHLYPDECRLGIPSRGIGACDRLEYPPSKRRVAVNHAETFNDIVSMDVNFWKITFKESPRVKTTLKVLNIVDAASGMHIATQIADQTAETIWRAFATG